MNIEEYSGIGKFIWLNPVKYPNVQKTSFTRDNNDVFCVAEFKKSIDLKGKVKRIVFEVTGAAQYFLWCNKQFIGIGPAAAGGDFLAVKPLSWQYVNRYEWHTDSDKLEIYAKVRLNCVVVTEFTPGKGVFLLSGKIEYEDGTVEVIGTDETWQGRVDRCYAEPDMYDEDAESDEWTNAVPTDVNVRLSVPDISNLVYTSVYGDYWTDPHIVQSGDKYEINYPRIHCAYLAVVASGECTLEIACAERTGVQHSEKVKFGRKGGNYKGVIMYSVGYLSVNVISAADGVTILPYIIDSRYPITSEGYLHTSDSELDSVYDTCKWTLSICRQSLHLDSPKHQELLACTGDYLVETNMTLFTFGDMRLAKQDICRTADWLCENDGRMFHTTYSLMWVQWLRNVYIYTGDIDILNYCKTALDTLFERFNSYVGEHGVIDNPPDYMFIDWLNIEGYNMHHPPKSLGQTVLCDFYYKALTDACALCSIMKNSPDSEWWNEKNALWSSRAEQFKQAFNNAFYDENEGLYIDGLSDTEEENKPWRPENVPLRHFSRHANVLAAMYGLCPESERERIIRRCADPNSDLQQVQPYFMNYVLDAVWKSGLFEDYGMQILDLWKPLVKTCSKGLQEGWIAPPNYNFDYSHAWGGTPAYHLPLALTGLSIIEPGYKKITLSPCLWGLKYADISFPTPYGQIHITQKEGEEAKITVPSEIEWEIV